MTDPSTDGLIERVARALCAREADVRMLDSDGAAALWQHNRSRHLKEARVAVEIIAPEPLSADVGELVEEARTLALAGDFSPDDLGGDIGTVVLRNPDGFRLLEIVQSLVTRNAVLKGALERCAKTFRRYAELHRAKGTTEGNLKASNNDDLAEFCESVLDDDDWQPM